jgi:uncharacterized protein YegL
MLLVFLVDRSGSMEGSRMEQVKAALQIMLRSLPSNNTYFVSYSLYIFCFTDLAM